ncbi:MAG: diguanylate cyclase [Pseudomonadota bacterium]
MPSGVPPGTIRSSPSDGGRGRRHSRRRPHFLCARSTMPARAAIAGWLFCLLWLLAAGGAAWAAGQGSVLKLEDQPSYALTPYLQVMSAPDAGLTVAQVDAPPWNARFETSPGPSLDLASESLQTFWLRFTFTTPPRRPAGRSVWLMTSDYVYLGKVDFYRPGPGGWEVVKTGLYRPFATRELANRSFVFALPPGGPDPTTCYMRLETRGFNPMRFRIWSLPAFVSHAAKEDLIFALCYGVLLSMILFNLFITVSLRDRAYLYYVCYMSSALLSLTCLHGHAAMILDLAPQSFTALFWVSMGLFTAFAYLFMRGLLNTKRLANWMDRALLAGFYYGLAIAAAGLLDWPWVGRWLALGSGVISPWLALGAGIASLRGGFVAARYFLMAWSALALGVGIFAMQEIGPLQGNYWARNALLLGTALESLLLSLALAARIRNLQRERQALTESEDRFKRLSYTDGLTSLFNKRYFSMQLEEALRGEAPPCLLVLDLDNFKQFNDTYGHDQGDLVLKGLAQVIAENVRASDTPCRWGGEEFAVILPGVEITQGAVIAERIRLCFAQVPFTPAQRDVHQTVSLGLVQARPGETAEKLIRRADQELYRAKKAGKNQLAVGY